MKLPYFTLLDDDLNHQVRFFLPTSSSVVQISCTCRAIRDPTTGRTHFDAIAPTADLEMSRNLYNDPDNHMRPFSPEDRAKW